MPDNDSQHFQADEQDDAEGHRYVTNSHDESDDVEGHRYVTNSHDESAQDSDSAGDFRMGPSMRF